MGRVKSGRQALERRDVTKERLSNSRWGVPGCGGLLPEGFNNETFSEPKDIPPVTATEEMEPIFVHIGAKEITIPCKPAKSDFVFGLNPTYNWTMVNGGSHFLGADATLTLHKFSAEDSGYYACTVSYVKDGQLSTKTFYHTVAGFHIRGELQALLVFQSSSCDEELTRAFLRILHERLVQLVSDFHSDIIIGDTNCFPTLDRPMDEFNLQVEIKVSPFKEGWDAACYPKIDELILECYRSAIHHHLQKAKEAMTEFLELNKHFPVGEPLASKASFINTFFNFQEDRKCQRGYGQTQELEARCPDCCTLCPPGTYSEATVDNCVLCPIGTYSLHYGASSCSLCQHNWLTSHPGASRAGDCMSLRVPPSRRFSVLMVAFVLPPLVCLCFIVLFCYCFRRRWQKKVSSDEQIEQEEESPALTEDAALLDNQEHDSSMLPSNLENLDNEAAMFSPATKTSICYSPLASEPPVFSSPASEPPVFSSPASETAVVSSPASETAVVSSPASEPAVVSPAASEPAVVSPPANVPAVSSPALNEAAVPSPSAKGSSLDTNVQESSVVLAIPSDKEVVVSSISNMEKEPSQVMEPPSVEPEESPEMESIEFPPSSPDEESA